MANSSRKASRKGSRSRRGSGKICKHGRDKSGLCRKKYGGNKGDRRRSKRDYRSRKRSRRGSKSRRRSSRKKSRRGSRKKSRRGSRKKSRRGSRKKSRRGSRKKSRRGSRKKSRRRGSRKKSRRGSRKKSRRRGSRKVPWAGWAQEAPQGKQRTQMLKDCGRKCFLGKGTSFPICTKGSCRINKKGLWAAYIRGRQYRARHPGVAAKASKLLDRRSRK